MTDLVHRIFLAPLRSDISQRRAHQHWTELHAGVFSRTPGLLGYVQNRPPAGACGGRNVVCSETWFESRAAERAAFESDYYLAEVAADEAVFVERDAAWLSAVTAVRAARRRRTYRVLAFGHGPEEVAGGLGEWDGHDIDVFSLQRPAPLCNRAYLLGLWTDDLERARDAAAYFGPLSILAQPAVVVPVPEAPWTATGPPRSNS